MPGEFVALVAAVYGFFFGFALLGKIDAWRSWSRAITAFLPAQPGIAAATRVSVPLAEAFVVVLAFAYPKLGLLAAGGLLATFAAVVAVLNTQHQGAACNCFGAVTSSKIGRPLAIRNFIAASVAIAVLVGNWNREVARLPTVGITALILLALLLLVASEFKSLRQIEVFRVGAENIREET